MKRMRGRVKDFSNLSLPLICMRAKARRWEPKMKTKVWAHRGASAYAPENTLEAFGLAAEQKADGVELDVHLSKDGKLVVAHDETLERVSNAEGYLKDYTLEELKQFCFNKLHPEYEAARIPTLEEVYGLLKPTGLEINVEIKTGIFFYPGIEEKLIELERTMGMEGRILYSSFNHYSAMKMKKLDPGSRVGLLYSEGFIDVPGYAARLGADALHPALYDLQYEGYLEDCRKNNLLVHVWTVDEEEEIRALVQNGIDAVITNKPDVARRIVDGTKR